MIFFSSRADFYKVNKEGRGDANLSQKPNAPYAKRIIEEVINLLSNLIMFNSGS